MRAKPRGKNRCYGEKGSVLVESAVTIVLLLMLLFGIIDFGRALYTYHFVANAAREATRWASVNGETCYQDKSCAFLYGANKGDVETYVQNLVPPGINSSQIAVATCGTQGGSECSASTPANCATTVNNPGCAVGVTVTYPFNFLVPLVRSGSINMSSSSQMTISH